MRFRFVVYLVIMAFLAQTGAAAAKNINDEPSITVMTRNLYLGSDLNVLLSTQNPFELPANIRTTFDEIAASDFPKRAERLAEEIATSRPHLVGLQEVALIRRQFPTDLSPIPNAEEVELNFLALLLGELQNQGQAYQAVVILEGTDLEFPDDTGTDRRFTDRDVILARSDVVVSNPQFAHFATNLDIALHPLLPPLTVLRGWVSVNATIDGQTVRLLSVHMETEVSPMIQEAQADELLALADGEPLPVIMVGDFNSPADGSTTQTYQKVLDAGFLDVWNQINPLDPGFTADHPPDLQSDASTLTKRIDFIFVSDGFIVGDAFVVGDDPVTDRVLTDDNRLLWPSDHAGVVATLLTPQESAPDLVVYDEMLRAPWIDASWGANVTFDSNEKSFEGDRAIKVQSNNFGALSVHFGPWWPRSEVQAVDPALAFVNFAICATDKPIELEVRLENDMGEYFPLLQHTTIHPQDGWVGISIPMSSQNPEGKVVNRLDIRDHTGKKRTFFVDAIRFSRDPVHAPIVPRVLSTTAPMAEDVPEAFALLPNAPNPFNPNTQIAYDIATATHVSLVVYNLLGQEVIRLVDGPRSPGRYVVSWDGRNAAGHAVSSGVYLYRLTTAASFVETRRMTLLQ